jgi:polyhydroxybutyrate depolymerase
MGRGLLALAILASCSACATTPTVHSGPVPRTPGTYERTTQLAARTRSFRIHIPPGYRAHGQSLPLVLVFHGRYGSGKKQAEISHFDTVADEHHFIVAYPDGIGHSWNSGSGAGPAQAQHIDDTKFAFDLARSLTRQLNADPRRIYAVGFSNGATFAYRLACSQDNPFAAIAAVAGTIAPTIANHCHSRGLPIVQISGTADRLNPWSGGHTAGGGAIESVTATVNFWLRRDHCQPRPTRKPLAADVSYTLYSDCRNHEQVALYQIIGGGHTWPGGEQYLPRLLIGRTSASIDASEAIWQFVARHHR